MNLSCLKCLRFVWPVLLFCVANAAVKKNIASWRFASDLTSFEKKRQVRQKEYSSAPISALEIEKLKEKNIQKADINNLKKWGVPEYELRALANDKGPKPDTPEDLYGWARPAVPLLTGSASVSEAYGEFTNKEQHKSGIWKMYLTGLIGYQDMRRGHLGYDPEFKQGVPDGLNMERFTIENINEYRTVNQFFTRTLKKLPSVDKENAAIVAAMADSMCVIAPNINAVGTEKGMRFKVKGELFSVRRFLTGTDDYIESDKKLKKEEIDLNSYDNGTLIIFRLRPFDYHHFHFPFTSKVIGSYKLAGKYHSVDPAAKKYSPMISNERLVVKLETSFGQALVVAVGALMVGKIVFEKDLLAQQKSVGDLLGHFEFGGSTVVLLLPEIAQFKQKDGLSFEKDREKYVRVGTTIGTINVGENKLAAQQADKAVDAVNGI